MPEQEDSKEISTSSSGSTESVRIKKESPKRKSDLKRRRMLTATLATGAVLSVDKWSKPVVESVVLPAHAQVTGPGYTINTLDSETFFVQTKPEEDPGKT